MTDIDLDAIEARANAATDGPWSVYQTMHAEPKVVNSTGHWPAGEVANASNSPADYGNADAEFIAHARTDVPALVAEVRRLREDADEDASVRDMLASLLTSTANALKGEPEQLWMHDWSDLPQVAGQHAAGLRTLSDTVALLTRERGELLAAIARVRALCAGADDSEYTTVFAAAVLAALDVRLLRGESS